MLQGFSQKVLNQLHKVIVFHYLNNNLEISTLQNESCKTCHFFPISLIFSKLCDAGFTNQNIVLAYSNGIFVFNPFNSSDILFTTLYIS